MDTITYKPISTKAFTEAMIARYEEENRIARNRNELEEINRKRRQYPNSFVYEASMINEQKRNRRNSFNESVKTTLLSEALFKIYSESVRDELKDDMATNTIMRKLISNFINENDVNSILRNMKTGSVLLSELYNCIQTSTRNIMESDEVKDGELTITPEMKDSFYDSLNYTDAGTVSDQIKDRVVDAMADFVETNAKEHDEIQETLANAAEKIDSVSTGDEEKDEEIAESYNFMAKSKVNKIRNGRKNIFHSLVTTMAEHVMRNPESQNEFMTEGKLDMNKIVNRVELMYGFMETVNTTRLMKIDEKFITETINELKK